MRALRIHTNDTVATLLEDVGAGDSVTVVDDVGDIVRVLHARTAIPMAHKISLSATEAGGDIVKYGEVIGTAICSIDKADHIHVHNADSRRIR
jgi:altronate dehydratase